MADRNLHRDALEHLKALADLGVAELRITPRAAEPGTPLQQPSNPSMPASGPLRREPARRAAGGSSSGSAGEGAPPLYAPAVRPDAGADRTVVRTLRQEDLFLERPEEGSLESAPTLLDRLRGEEIGDCVRCRLSGGRKTIVFGTGNPEADLMFVGEGPGADEDEQGLPFVGRAGQLLTKMIASMTVGGRRLSREEVYIANIIKCRPPGNRDPEPDEIAACEGFLFRQIAIVRPRVVVALGAFAARTLLRSKAPISALRGRLHEYRGTLLMPTYHPAYVLRNYTEETRRTVFEDLKKAAAELERST